MLTAQVSAILIDAALAAEGSPSALTEGPYGWIGGLIIFAVSAGLFLRNALLQLKQPKSETNIYADGPIAVALKTLDRIGDAVADLPSTERRMIELRDHFAAAVETTRRNFYLHVAERDRETEARVRLLEQKVAVLESQRRQRASG